ncbi:origin recognition complex subunit 3 N-terminus-domain-containing protein [Cokeromyces recurvatus]|uniref:origin recognition complex subunit 3 N-terminus-domain-containing protein n=1 Tax=Cokeromyces recurvatus TaxID=90255 RepID=UPI00222047EF|nr:origin recognition complex subunit 3 N-terminus-domain-containing protein [Cokeromyces recurvatus]KAI7899494.1 origin recognition complex subunit 3 N-terminus-domain-containing protein [Cokeromyces recurvatus]
MIERFLANAPRDFDPEVLEEEENEFNEEEDEDIIRTESLLEGWYRHQCVHSPSNPNLVIILQDFESFEPAVLQDFFTICSEYRSSLPIVCIMGIATSTEILHQSLSKSTIELLRIEKFRLEQSEVWFNRVIEKIFLDSLHTLKFGARPYKFLLDHFYLYDFSISKVTASIKYALMHHFYGNPLSIFLPLLGFEKTKTKSILSEWLDNNMLNEHHITFIRMLNSFKNYIEDLASTDPKKALRLLEDDRYLITEVAADLLDDIKIYQKKFKMGIHLLTLLQAQFPSFTSFTSLKKSKRILLLEALETQKDFAEKGELIKSLVILTRKIDEEHIGKLLNELRDFFEQDDYKDISQPTLAQLDIWDSRYKQLSEADETFVAKMSRKAKLLEGMVLPEAQTEKGRHTETARKVQTESIEHLKRKGTEASKIAMSIAEWFEKMLTDCLKTFNKVPLHELVYYTNITLHEKSFASQPRASIQTALTQPQHYINCSCCDTEKSDEIIPSEHDTCILYKLYLECGRMINLYDWFVAFGCVIEREKRAANQKLEENEVQARFIRSVAELQFLGFIKPTQRKTDHVIRLTWSNI